MRSLSKSRSRSSLRVRPFGSHAKRSHKKHAKRSFGKRKLNPKMKVWNKVVKEMGYMKPGHDFHPIPKRSTRAGKEMRHMYMTSLKKAGL